MPQYINKFRVISHSYDCGIMSKRTEGKGGFPIHDTSSDCANWREQPTDRIQRHAMNHRSRLGTSLFLNNRGFSSTVRQPHLRHFDFEKGRRKTWSKNNPRVEEQLLGSVKKYMVHVYISSSGHLWPVFNRETFKIAQLFLLFLSFRSTQSDLNLSVFMYHVFLYGPLLNIPFRRREIPTPSTIIFRSIHGMIGNRDKTTGIC